MYGALQVLSAIVVLNLLNAYIFQTCVKMLGSLLSGATQAWLLNTAKCWHWNMDYSVTVIYALLRYILVHMNTCMTFVILYSLATYVIATYVYS